MTSGDFNGDGKSDLVIIVVQEVFLLLSNGQGDFPTRQTLYRITSDENYHLQPENVLAIDLNRDSKLDIVTVNAEGQISVFLGMGDGTFQPRRDYPTNQGSSSITSGDFNGDGKLDLATANTSGGDISILLDKDDGAFQTALSVEYGTRCNPMNVASGDFNKDGKADLAVMNGCSRAVSVLIGKGDGNFQWKADYWVGGYALAVSDSDEDGNLDLVATNESDGTVGILAGNGDGTFQEKKDYLVGHGPAELAVTDLNGDGHFDIATANHLGNSVSVLLGNGDGSFQGQQEFPVGTEPRSLAVGDFNGDGKPDLATVNYKSNDASILLNQLPPVLSVQLAPRSARPGDPLTVTVTSPLPLSEPPLLTLAGPCLSCRRVPLQGGPDRFTGTFTVPSLSFGCSATVTALAARSNASPLAGVATLTLNGDLPPLPLAFEAAEPATDILNDAVALADLNHDGLLDLVFTSGGDAGDIKQRTTIQLNQGDGTFAEGDDYPVRGTYLGVGDLDGDGSLDLVTVPWRGAGPLSTLLNRGDGSFDPPQTLPPGPQINALALGDFNGDRKADLVLAEGTDDGILNDRLGVLLGNGDGTFQPEVPYPAGEIPSSVVIADFNRDGKLDLAVADSRGQRIRVFGGTGDGTFEKLGDTAYGGESLTVGDFDGDGIPDLAAANAANVSVLLGRGDGGFDYRGHTPVGSGLVSMALEDYDGDGKLDLAVGSRAFPEMSVALGRGDGTFLAQQKFPLEKTPFGLAAGDVNGDGKADLVTAIGTQVWLNRSPVTLSVKASPWRARTGERVKIEASSPKAVSSPPTVSVYGTCVPCEIVSLTSAGSNAYRGSYTVPELPDACEVTVIGGAEPSERESLRNEAGFRVEACGDRAKGDVDGDGVITVRDALSVLQMAVGVRESSCGRGAADVDCDGRVTVRDAVSVLRKSVGMGELPDCLR
jgi:hypothetical protein